MQPLNAIRRHYLAFIAELSFDDLIAHIKELEADQGNPAHEDVAAKMFWEFSLQACHIRAALVWPMFYRREFIDGKRTIPALEEHGDPIMCACCGLCSVAREYDLCATCKSDCAERCQGCGEITSLFDNDLCKRCTM